MRLHSGDKPYNCKECPAKFNQQVHLRLHKKAHLEGNVELFMDFSDDADTPSTDGSVTAGLQDHLASTEVTDYFGNTDVTSPSSRDRLDDDEEDDEGKLIIQESGRSLDTSPMGYLFPSNAMDETSQELCDSPSAGLIASSCSGVEDEMEVTETNQDQSAAFESKDDVALPLQSEHPESSSHATKRSHPELEFGSRSKLSKSNPALKLENVVQKILNRTNKS